MEPNSNGEEVNEFLQRIRELGDKRDREDEERTKQLEREIIAGREARRARRDERARSLSPQKDSPVGTPLSLASLASSRPSTRDGEETKGRLDQAGALEKLTGKLEGLTPETALPPPESPLRESPRTAPALSWQRRQRSNSRSPTKTEETKANEAEEPSRSQIAASLGSKDPAWFRQTPDRNASSRALRKTTDEAVGPSARTALPGMSLGEKPADSIPDPVPEPEKSPSPNRGVLGSFPPTTRMSRSDSLKSVERLISSRSAPGLNLHTRNASVTDSSGRFELSSNEARPMPMSPSQGRISPERKERTSPTKNFGGFVQSALLKREGSTKRWSNSHQHSGSISRQNSTTSPTSGFPRPTSSPQSQGSGENSPAGDDSTGDNGMKELADSADVINRGRSSSQLDPLAKSKSAGALFSDIPNLQKDRESSPPAIQTKTYDPKRWSPTKSSWLESALKKGNEPQPSTMPSGRNFPRTPAKAPENTSQSPASSPIKPLAKPKPSELSPKPSEIPSDGAQEPEKPTPPAKSPAISTKSIAAAFTKPPLRSSATDGPPTSVDKPSIGDKPTPGPKQPINFRASLKPRPQVDKGGDKEDLPFLDARSRLRASKTQNYKPPDELKEQILDGKSKLSSTDGPQKNPKPDFLKESVVSARAGLRQSGPAASPPSPTKSSPIEPKPRTPEFQKQTSAPGRLEEKKGSLASRFNPNLANLLQRGPPPVRGNSPQTDLSSSSSASVTGKPSKDDTEDASGGGTLIHMTKSRARGPKRRAPTKAENTKPDASIERSQRSPAATDKPSITPKPQNQPTKRPMPPEPSTNSPPAENTVNAQSEETSSGPKISSVLEKVRSMSPAAGTGLPPATPVKRSLPPAPTDTDTSSARNTPTSVSQKAKPPAPAKSPLLRSTSSTSVKETEPEKPIEPEADTKSTMTPVPPKSSSPIAFSRKGTLESSLSKGSSPASTPSMTRLIGDGTTSGSPVSVKNAASIWGRHMETSRPTKPPSPTSGAKGPQTGLGITGAAAAPAQPVISEPSESARSGSRPLPKTPLNSSSPQAVPTSSEAKLFEFFKGPSFRAPKFDFDVEGILSSAAMGYPQNVKTIQFEVSEITGYGKLKPVPRAQDHVFFDEMMYLCVHTFERAPRKTEVNVYLWNGQQVSDSAVEDAQLFARKTAREKDAQLIRLQQGLETAAFFQAIGGILITRRGVPENFDPVRPFMLRGRSWQGGMAFDDVDMNTSSLCSGFPYLISCKGVVYLWKGKGSIPDELLVSRMVGFDLSGGEVVEVEEGDEPEEIFEALGSDERPPSADYWRLKPSCKTYTVRLFKMDTQKPTKMIEITPFRQSSLDPHEIYVMDAYFEVYIVLGAKAQSKREEFQAALQFTQDYSILAVTIQDRPFIPVSSVILGGAPREFRALFRTWDDSKIMTEWNPTRKPSLRLMGLNEAMEVMSSR